MRHLIWSFFVFLLTASSLAQSSNDKNIYLDSLFLPTAKSESTYYMIVQDYNIIKPEYFMTVYYTSGKIESKGHSKNRDFFSKKGEIISYHENGNTKSIVFFEDSFPNGKCTLFYENGVKKMEGRYIMQNDKSNKKTSKMMIENAWDINNMQTVKDGIGEYEDDEYFEVRDKNPFLKTVSKGEIRNGFKTGKWVGHNKKHKFTFSEEYLAGDLISGQSINKNNEENNYTSILKNPEPAGEGINSIYKHIGANFKIPDNGNFKGRVLLSFIIDTEGKIINPKIINSIGERGDKEALRVIRSYSKRWVIGEIRGIKSSFAFYLPISFN